MRGRGCVGVVVATLLAMPVWAAEDGPRVQQAWTPAAAKGADTPLFMTVDNTGAEDAVLRARCPAAQFSELHIVDHGEGFPAMRVVKSIAVAKSGMTRLDADGPHVMLLQTVSALAPGEAFTCTVTFRNSGAQTVEVTVGAPE